MSAHTEIGSPRGHHAWGRIGQWVSGAIERTREWADRRDEPGLAVYVFGKHPAWPDFIDVAQLPPLPRAFRHLHDSLRQEIEVAYGEPSAVPRLMLWQDRRGSSILLIHPSRDSGRQFRVAPLLLGLTADASLGDLMEFAGPRLCDLAGRLFGRPCGEQDVVTQINRSAKSWREDYANQRAFATADSGCRVDVGALFKQAAEVTRHTSAGRPQVIVFAPPPQVVRAADVPLSQLSAGQLRGMIG